MAGEMTAVDDTAGGFTSRRSVVRSRRTAGASRRAVLIALAANVVVAAAKLAGGLITGSAAMLRRDRPFVRRFREPRVPARVDPAVYPRTDSRAAVRLWQGAVSVDIRRRGFDEIDEVVELLTMTLGPNSLLVAARVDFTGGLGDDEVERISEEIDERLRQVVPDVTEVFLDATTAHRHHAERCTPTAAEPARPGGAGSTEL